MKICYLADARSNHTRRWVEYFAKEHEIDLITLSYTKKEETAIPEEVYVKMNVRVHKVSKRMPFLMLAPFKIRRLIKKMKPDIVHAHYVTQYGFCGAFSSFHPLVMSTWGSDISEDPDKSKILRFLVKYAFKKADLVQTGDEPGKKRLIELGCNENKILIQPTGIDINRFSPETKSEDLRRKIGIEDKYSVFTVRGFRSGYNLDVFIKAIPHVLKEIPDVKFIIGGPDYNRGSEFKKLVEELGIDKDVLFTGLIPNAEMPKYLANADIYVGVANDPKKAGGGIGTTPMEAMACETPILLAERSYLKAYGRELANEPWFHGLVYKRLGEKDLADKIIHLLKNKELREELGKAGRKTALETGNLEKNLNEWGKLYDELVRGGR